MVASLNDSSRCILDFPRSESYYQDGDLIIGGVITVHLMRKNFLSDFTTVPFGFYSVCFVPHFMSYQNLLAFVFAIQEINRDPELLPNITLGFHLDENCLQENRANIGALGILSGGNHTVPNYQCDQVHKLVAIVDGISSKVSLLLARLYGMYKIPQIKYAAMDPVLSDKISFPTSYRTVPNEIVQYKAIVDLIKHFGWSWVGILASDNESGLQINKYMKNIHFTNGAGENVHFDENGDISAGFDIISWIVYANESLDGIKVGSYDPQAISRELIINDSIVRWNPVFTKIPMSQCSEICAPGFRKSARQGALSCCYDCIPCPDGEIASEADMDSCTKCPEDQWHNSKRNLCVHKVVTYLSYEEPLGMSLAFISFLLFLLSGFILALFIKKKDTPIVKANNRDLSFILLLSLKMCFLCSLIFIGHPLRVTCILRQTVFGVSFSVSVSSILAKTVTVVIAFKAVKPGSRLRKFLGNKFSNSIVLFCSLLQVVICVTWLGTSPPFPRYNMEDEVGKIVAECNEGSLLGFYIVLGYMGFLALVSFLIAFLARNLPDAFNEAKYITFSMLVFCSVWISFIPAYLSSKGKYVVAVEIFAILASSSGLLLCIFIPKCYVILRKPSTSAKNL